MATAYIELSDQETQALQKLVQQTGKTQEELLHEAVTELLNKTENHRQRIKRPTAMGKYAYISGSSEGFAREKQNEIAHEDRQRV